MTIFQTKKNKKRQELVSTGIANFIAKDMVLTAIVEGKGFI